MARKPKKGRPLPLVRLNLVAPILDAVDAPRSLRSKIKSAPLEILKRYEKWKDIVTISGPKGLKLIKGFHDETLQGELKGCRSSRLGSKYRVIYKVKESEVMVQVLNLTAHDFPNLARYTLGADETLSIRL